MINRAAQSFDQAAAYETETFAHQLEQRRNNLGFPQAALTDTLARVMSRCGVDKLIARLYTRFLEHVQHTWRAGTKANLNQKILEARGKYEDLGCEARLLTMENVLLRASSQVKVFQYG